MSQTLIIPEVFADAVNANDDIVIKSLPLLNEMKTYEYADGKMNAEIGKHDDTVIATALAIQGVRSGVRYH